MPSHVWSGTWASGTSSSCRGHIGTYKRGQLSGTFTRGSCQSSRRTAGTPSSGGHHHLSRLCCRPTKTTFALKSRGMPRLGRELISRAAPGAIATCLKPEVNGPSRTVCRRTEVLDDVHNSCYFLSSVVTLPG